MLKKLLWPLALLLLSNANAYTLAKGNPYLGAALGNQHSENFNGLYANFFTGFGIRANKFYLAGELFADTGSIPLSHNFTNRTTYGAGVSLLPGFTILQNTLAYGRVGIAEFRYNRSNDWRAGGQLGIGLQTSFSKHWSIRGEYIYMGKGIFRGFGTSRFSFFNLGALYTFK